MRKNKIKTFLFSLLLLLPFGCSAYDYTDEAISYPIAFAQVREDPLQDQEVINHYFPEGKISMLMIASGGDTAAYLAGTAPISRLMIVDPNLAQISLTKLKLHLLSYPTQKRLEVLGHAPMDKLKQGEILSSLKSLLDIPNDVFGELSDKGLDQSGRYERVFAALREELKPFESEILNLFTLNSVEEQARRISPDTALGKAIDNAFESVMSQENLIKIFGEKATANRVQDFSKHFAQRTRYYLSHHLASESPFFAQMFLGQFYDDILYPWLSLPIVKNDIKIEYFNGMMNEYLEKSMPEQYDVIHLSNILDWLSPEEAQNTLELVFKALKPDGVVIIRQLNSNINIPSMGEQFFWNIEESENLNINDRSFFYPNFYIGFKPHRSSAPIVTNLADEVLKNTPILDGDFFSALKSGEMSLEQFRETQEQFFYAVDYFSRPMAALIARLPRHAERKDILHNIVEEHGDFDVEKYHSNTFKLFLKSLGSNPNHIESKTIHPEVMSFNTTLMGASLSEDPLVAIGCLGIIEYAFADISAEIGRNVIDRRWIKKDDLSHYSLHAELDKRHSEEFFAIAEPYMKNPEDRKKVLSGLKLGAYIFNKLYEDLYRQSLENSTTMD